MSAMVKDLPDRARIVVIGGGVGGTSVAYHLALRGETDVLLLDRDELTSGSTFHSAGLVGQLRSDPTLTAMNMYSVELYRALDKTESPPGWVETGSIRLASSHARMEEIHRQISWARTFGLPLEEISAQEAADLFPPMVTDGVVGAAYMPTDGQVDPSMLCNSMAAAARREGATIRTHTRVLGIDTEGSGNERRVSAVRTDRGDIETDIVVNCGGMFAAEIARMVGVRVPVIPMSHQYLVTEACLERRETPMPSLRDPDLLVYFRQEVDALLMGGYERQSLPWTASPSSFDAIPADFNGRLLPDDWDRFLEITDNSRVRVPLMGEIGIRKLINGPEAFTPDNEFCLGESEVAGFFVAAGFCAHGIAGAGGIGKVMADWIVDGDPGLDLWHMDVRRFGPAYRSPSFTLKRTVENYETYYDIRYPGHERRAGRPLLQPPQRRLHLGALIPRAAQRFQRRAPLRRQRRGDFVVHPRSLAPVARQSGALQHRQVPRDFILRHVERAHDLTHAQLPLQQQAHDEYARRIGQRLLGFDDAVQRYMRHNAYIILFSEEAVKRQNIRKYLTSHHPALY